MPAGLISVTNASPKGLPPKAKVVWKAPVVTGKSGEPVGPVRKKWPAALMAKLYPNSVPVPPIYVEYSRTFPPALNSLETTSVVHVPEDILQAVWYAPEVTGKLGALVSPEI